MADRFTIQLQDQELRARLDRAAGKLADATRLFDQIGAVMERRINQRFDTKQDPAGAGWKALAASTRAKYAKADGDRRQGTLLERTGRMRASLGTNVGRDRVEIGFGVPIAAYHETGTKTKKGTPKMPRRGLLTGDPQTGTLGRGDRDAVLKVINGYLDGLFD